MLIQIFSLSRGRARLVVGNERVPGHTTRESGEEGVHLVLAPEELDGAIRPFVKVDLPQRS